MGNELTYENGKINCVDTPASEYNPMISPIGVEGVRIDWKRGDLTGTIRTNIEFAGKGTVYGVETVQQGKHRVDWKIGHIDGTYATGWDCYYEGEFFYQLEFGKVPENGPSGKYEDNTFYQLIEINQGSEEDEYEDGENASNWVIRRFGTSIVAPETRLDEWYKPAWENKYGES